MTTDPPDSAVDVAGGRTNGATNGHAVSGSNGHADRKVNGAFVALCTKTCYVQGLLVVNRTLKKVKSSYPLIVFATAGLPADARAAITHAGIRIIDVDDLKPEDGRIVVAEHDKRFEEAWAKMRAWELVEFDRIVLMDCDMLVRHNMDELFTMELPGDDWIAAAHVCACNPMQLAHYPPDWVPENCAYTGLAHPKGVLHPCPVSPSPRPHQLLNSGLVVLQPSREALDAIMHFISTSDELAAFKFTDQDTLASVYRGRWMSLPYIYNGLKTLRKIHPDLWRDDTVKNVHYILDKPWDCRPGTNASWPVSGRAFAEEHEWWWAEYDAMIDEMKRDPKSGWEVVDAWVAH